MTGGRARVRTLIAAAAIAALTACAPATVWHMDGVTAEQRDSDLAYCRSQAQVAAGPYVPPPSRYRYDPYRKYDNPYQPLGESISSAGSTMGHALAYQAHIEDLTRYCMQTLGYREVLEEELALQGQ